MSKSLPPFDPGEASKFFFRHGHSGWLGLKYSAHAENWVELELPWRENLLGEPDRAVDRVGRRNVLAERILGRRRDRRDELVVRVPQLLAEQLVEGIVGGSAR